MELYVHLPFCKKKCRYCTFSSYSGEERHMEAYTKALIREAQQQRDSVTDDITTVYIGGGTPSLLPAELMEFLLRSLRATLPMDHVSEFTVEANPGTLKPEWLETVKDFGVNRVSLGMQACQDRILESLGRIHRYREVENAVNICRTKGLDNLNLDLMFGIPGQTENDWLETLEKALSLKPEHISAYGLIPEPGTELYEKLEKGEWILPEPEAERRMYDDAIRILETAGLRQYEISNFARDGKTCKHNIGYWRQIPYLGLGCSAASMLDFAHTGEGLTYRRTTNPSDLKKYLSMIREGTGLKRETEIISHADARFETMMLSLRMNDGVREQDFFRMHGMYPEEAFGDKLNSFLNSGFLMKTDGAWRLTGKGMDFQNQVLVELMDDSSASV